MTDVEIPLLGGDVTQGVVRVGDTVRRPLNDNSPRRCRLLADAYGMSDIDRSRLVEVAIMRTRRSWHLMKRRAEVDGGGWLRMWNEGVGGVIKRREAWLERNASLLDAALTS